jgi:hypothetical protein
VVCAEQVQDALWRKGSGFSPSLALLTRSHMCLRDSFPVIHEHDARKNIAQGSITWRSFIVHYKDLTASDRHEHGTLALIDVDSLDQAQIQLLWHFQLANTRLGRTGV